MRIWSYRDTQTFLIASEFIVGVEFSGRVKLGGVELSQTHP
jgi:hypothetical protein